MNPTDITYEGSSDNFGSNILNDSIRVISETVGISSLSDESCTFLAEEMSYFLKTIVQDATKHCIHSKRRALCTVDIDHALQARHLEPVYGMSVRDHIPFRFASGGGRELYFVGEKDLDLQEVIASRLPSVPPDITLKFHWLAVKGVQPAIPENPPAITKELQKREILDNVTKAAIDRGHKLPGVADPGTLKRNRPKSDCVKLKDLTQHELSVEQQYFYKEATEACVGPDESKRAEALQSLASDSGLHQMLPRFITFVAEGVKVNVVQANLALLIYLMRMVKSLLDNRNLYMEKYLHLLIPAMSTCVVSCQLCMRPEADNHWALRDFAARLISTVCKNFSNSTNNVQPRLTKLFIKALTDKHLSLGSYYGAIAGLGELGTEVIRCCVMENLTPLGERMRSVLDGVFTSPMDQIGTDHIVKQLHKYVVCNALKVVTVGGSHEEDFKEKFGCLGPLIFNMWQTGVVPSFSSQQPPAVQRQPLQLPIRGGHSIVIHQVPPSASTPITPSAGAAPFTTAGFKRSTAGTIAQSVVHHGQQGKFVLVTSQGLLTSGTKPGSDVNAVGVSSAASSAGGSIVRVVPASTGTAGTGAVQRGAQKILLIQGADARSEGVASAHTLAAPDSGACSATPAGLARDTVFPDGQAPVLSAAGDSNS